MGLYGIKNIRQAAIVRLFSWLAGNFGGRTPSKFLKADIPSGFLPPFQEITTDRKGRAALAQHKIIRD